jgi:hypothetical protein
MALSKTIAGLIGPTLGAIGAAMLLNLGSFAEMVKQIAEDPGLIFLSGVPLLVAGIAILRVHNLWTGGWPVVVTVLGWLAVIGGLMRMFLPFRLAAMAAVLAQHTVLIAMMAIVVLLVGAFLSYKAYGRD